MPAAANKPGPNASWRLLEGYHPVDSLYDELVVGPDLRPHCEVLVRSLEGLGRHELASRWERARRAVRDNGVTYNVYGDPQGVNRPLVIAAAEWHRLEQALIQRTRLLNQILADLYGPQRLLRTGIIPTPLAFANPAFLRACHGIQVPGQTYLHLHAVDLVRTPAGQWRALADHTQAPTGAGYALENRFVLSRSLPEAFRDCQVERIASFFRTHRDALSALAPQRRHEPRIVLLTPGPYSDTYFEHAYLARYLGLTLAEGGDLTVRDRRVYIKTLEGLEPVDVIFRRLDDSLCDPLELGRTSSIGVAGLVEAARAGSVAIANALGSGAIESAAITGFLPDLCRELLGEPLALPSVTTWWCGEPQALHHVLDHLDRLVIKRAFPSSEVRLPIFGWKLSATQRAALAAEMRARPAEFVGQEQVAPSTAPVWLGGRVEPRPLVFRAYVAAAGGSYAAMPGGLTRVSSARELSVVSMRRGGGSKDTWVLSESPVSAASPLTPAGPPTRARERRAAELPSRVADNFFWLGRHAERAEHTVRLVRSIVARLSNEVASPDAPELLALRKVLVDLELVPARLAEPMPMSDLESELLAVLFRQRAQTGLRRTLNEILRIAAAVRDRLSQDTWRALNQLQQDFRLRHGRIQFDDVLAHLNRMITDLAAFSGMMENTTRGHGWRFLDIGRRLERSINLTALLRAALAEDAAENGILDPLLEIADSSMTYRRRYFGAPQLSPVLDLLLADPANARGLLFQLTVLSDHLPHLPRDPRAPSPTKEERLIAHAKNVLAQTDIESLSAAGQDGAFPRLMGFLASIEEDLRACSDAITYYYFSHAELRVS
jgi:uncharacterized circularly permuted ATP-grasp superfamily protein/uncharacterized alpha-E superfamily protein